MNFQLDVGLPWPLGAHARNGGVNFAVFSEHAKSLILCVFDDNGANERQIKFTHKTAHVWHVFVEGLSVGCKYGFRADGEYEPSHGLRFNVNKLLIDPYARDIDRVFKWNDIVFSHPKLRRDTGDELDARDSAGYVPLSIVCERLNADEINRIQGGKPLVPWDQTVIYEGHVRGLTKLNNYIPESLRGTFKGLAQTEVISYLKELGISALELLPVHGFVDEEFIVDHGLSNYWGYNSLNFFMPHKAYLNSGKAEEFRELVLAYHEAGLEIILDVVYNHTAESNQHGPHLSFRGLDNKSYYRLEANDASLYVNDTGCGNTLNIDHPRVLQMVLDSLRFWAGEMGVDGFRFDLASILGRRSDGFTSDHPFFHAIQQDPLLSTCKMIAEPWDIGPGGYQLGNFPILWSEWNDKYRDTVRKFWKGEPGVLPEFVRRIHGSSDVFDAGGRNPRASVNFITSHDGFSMADLVSYRKRNNLANKENNRDGHSANFSENYGFEGPCEVKEINDLRYRQIKNFIATLAVSQGIPMLLAGDEIANSQNGNNNAYCQDNSLSWIDWSELSSYQKSVQEFTKKVLHLRKNEPLLRWNRFAHKTEELSDDDPFRIRWLCATGREMRDTEWKNPNALNVGRLIEGICDGKYHRVLVLFNAAVEHVEFNLAEHERAYSWRRLINTADETIDHETVKIDVTKPINLISRSLQILKSVDTLDAIQSQKIIIGKKHD